VKLDADDPSGAAVACRRAQAIARAIRSERCDQIDARLKQMAGLMKAAREIENMKVLLARDPANVAAREKLVRLYLVDLDDPAAAAKHLEGVKDPSLKKYVPAAAKGAEAAPELACLELAEWYRGFGEAAEKGAKAAMFARAKAYYERFLSLHETDDLGRTAATVALKKVEAELEELGGAAPPTRAGTKATPAVAGGTIKPGKWVDLLPLVDPAQDAVAGTWQRRGSAIVVPTAKPNGRITVPVLPQGNYELQGRFVRTAGNTGFGIILPVGSSSVSLQFSGGSGGAAHGLSRVNRQSETRNETGFRPGTLQNGREYAVHARVLLTHDLAEVTATLDGKKLFVWQGSQSALSLYPLWTLPQQGCLGLVAGNTAVTWHDLRLKMLSGEARLLRPKDK